MEPHVLASWSQSRFISSLMPEPRNKQLRLREHENQCKSREIYRLSFFLKLLFDLSKVSNSS